MYDRPSAAVEQYAEELSKKHYSSFVNGQCIECGAYAHPKGQKQHQNFHANYIHHSQVKDGFNVSAVAWCDMGDHAFKKNSPGAQSIDIMQRNEAGVEERVTMDICGAHAFPAGSNNPTMRAVEASYKRETADEIPPYTD